MNSNLSLREFLVARHRELNLAASEIAQKLKSLEDELRHIRASAATMGIKLEKPEMSRPSINARTARGTKTMKDAAVEILEEAAGGLTANEILDVMRDSFGLDYVRSSLSPQLSRLKYEGIVCRQDGRWLLTKYAKSDHDT